MFPTNDISNGKTKYVGRARAIVIDNRDPLLRGRIRIQHPTMGPTGWIDYLRSPGTFDAPPIGSVVYAEADGGFYNYLIAHGNITIGSDVSPNLNPVFQRAIPTNHGFFTPNNHLIEMDDGLAISSSAPIDNDLTAAHRGIKITTTLGNTIRLMEDDINNQQYILLQDISGDSIKLDYKNKEITITSAGNQISNTAGNYNINVTGTATIKAPTIIFNSNGSGITTANSHQNCIDLITGVPVTPSTTTFGDV